MTQYPAVRRPVRIWWSRRVFAAARLVADVQQVLKALGDHQRAALALALQQRVRGHLREPHKRKLNPVLRMTASRGFNDGAPALQCTTLHAQVHSAPMLMIALPLCRSADVAIPAEACIDAWRSTA